MNRTNAVQSGIRIYVMLAVALGVYQMVSYQMGARNRPIDATANSTNVETNSTDGVPSEPTNQTAVPSNVQVFATMRLEPGAREVLQSNGIESAILSYELKGVDWIYNICINYGHILVAMVIYNKFKEGGNEGGRKFKLLALGAIVVFGWIYLANTLAIERVAVRSKSGKLLYHADHTFTKERFDEFVKQNREMFVVKELEKDTPIIAEEEVSSSPNIPEDVEVDEEGNVFSRSTNEEF